MDITWILLARLGALRIRHRDRAVFDSLDGKKIVLRSLGGPAVPFWWYAQTMRDIQRVQPDVAFFLSCTGDLGRFAEQLTGMKVLTPDAPSHYGYKGKDHDSQVNPVADIFALACCPILLATPISGYSHWAANALGAPTDCLLPLPGATREQAARMGAEIIAMGEGFGDIDFSRTANTE